mgnify:CR=1 FL=1
MTVFAKLFKSSTEAKLLCNKEATAVVRLRKGKGAITVNKKSNDKQEEAEKNSNDFNLFESLGLCGSSRF